MRSLVFFLSFFATLFFKAQVIVNAYAKITAVTNSSVLALSNVNQTNHTFIVGEKVIVMQMQDDVIGGNTTNAATFGNLSAIASAGLYEVGIILSRTPATGNPTSITLSTALDNTYNTGTNSSLQLITFRNMGVNFTSTSDITGLVWNGDVGGVIAIEADNTLTLNHRILADGIGFRGGDRSENADQTCVNTSYRVNDDTKSFKGEGIFRRTAANQLNGRGKIINGGGGGSENNAGGGGGANYTAGGQGGRGYQCTNANGGFGLGGVSLGGSISSSRIFMGGGGGGGQQNNTAGSNGGRGGGIILLKANNLATSATCVNPVRISANGITANNSSNDGSGGGGAGGSVMLQVNSYSVTTTCPLINSGSGGSGGNVTDGASHGGGGGGGQGVIIYSVPLPTTNITTSVSNGSPGADNSGGTITGTSGAGTNGSGLVIAGTGPLPIELLSFSAETQKNGVKLLWSTGSEKDNDYFTLERSADGESFISLGIVKGAGTSNYTRSYNYYDTEPLNGISYYRLKQTDFSKKFDYSPLISVNYKERLIFTVSPNPVDVGESVVISMDGEYSGMNYLIKLVDLNGKEIVSKTLMGQEVNQINLSEFQLQPGVYILKLENGSSSDFKKLLVR